MSDAPTQVPSDGPKKSAKPDAPPVRDKTPSRRLLALAMLLVAAAIVRLVLSHADRSRARRAAEDVRHRAAARVMGAPDLALSSSSRWLRHPSQTESGAAFSDGPATPDMDPAGAVIAPPRDVLRRGAFGGEIVRRRRHAISDGGVAPGPHRSVGSGDARTPEAAR
ncbi:MAG: hypothetical protein IT379_36665 [Deltaproteobacteria bacterium]|nr:hypothetical protein [Deltaproteobacteria bacterium]